MSDNPQLIRRIVSAINHTPAAPAVPVRTMVAPPSAAEVEALNAKIKAHRDHVEREEGRMMQECIERRPVQATPTASMRPSTEHLQAMAARVNGQRLDASETDLLTREVATLREKVNELTEALRKAQAPRNAGQPTPKPALEARQESTMAPNGVITHTAMADKPGIAKPTPPASTGDLWPWSDKELSTNKVPHVRLLAMPGQSVVYHFRFLKRDLMRIGKEKGVNAEGNPVFEMEKELSRDKAHEFWRLLRDKGFLLVGKEIALANEK